MRPFLLSEIGRLRRAFSDAWKRADEAGNEVQALIEVWSDRDGAVFNADDAGFTSLTGEGGRVKIGEMSGRFYGERGGEGEQEFGAEIENVTEWVFVLNRDEAPPELLGEAGEIDVRGSDQLRVGARVFEVANIGGEGSFEVLRHIRCKEITNG